MKLAELLGLGHLGLARWAWVSWAWVSWAWVSWAWVAGLGILLAGFLSNRRKGGREIRPGRATAGIFS